jgi:hypothetical protein
MRSNQHVHGIDLHRPETVHEFAERSRAFRRSDRRNEHLCRQRDAAGLCERERLTQCRRSAVVED